MTRSRPLDVESLRRIVVETCGHDPGALEHTTRLTDVGLAGYSAFCLFETLEELYDIDFPTDLYGTMETVDDVVYFTNIKLSHRGP